jgi:hypothetical protein
MATMGPLMDDHFIIIFLLPSPNIIANKFSFYIPVDMKPAPLYMDFDV